ncbi:MAG TPA: hypothetical protein VGZ32_08255 [Actinocrinis sp.]|jgi:hypothetical protein|uniref:hypothetical protein n=1 Tax=Actinocrinis sp. TaxID=1920516 RepID=UPI002DDCA453|nr:hypothetical protein [Actinocrinis sp.]HEV3170316.1 hypothetical protein [Actinocrinis sp.]
MTENSQPQAAATDDDTAAQRVGTLTARRRTWGVVVLVAIGLAAGIWGSWAYNAGFRTRAADDSAIIVAGADRPAFVDQASSGSRITMPVSNYSPYTVTVYDVQFIDATGMTWDGKNGVIRPGQTVNLTVTAPTACALNLAPNPTPTKLADAYVHVRTLNGKQHGITLYYSGLLMYVVHQCGSTPTDTSAP